MKLRLKLFWTFFKIGALTIGGGYAMVPLIEKEIVDKKKWVLQKDMVDIFAVSQSIPGVIAINSASFVGYKVGKYSGAIFATLGMILPSFIIITLIAGLFLQFQNLPVIRAAFVGINAAVIALITAAGVRIGRVALKDFISILILIFALFLLLLIKIHAIYIIIIGALLGLILFYIFKITGKKTK